MYLHGLGKSFKSEANQNFENCSWVSDVWNMKILVKWAELDPRKHAA